MNHRKRVHYWHNEEYLKSQRRDYLIPTVEEYNNLVDEIKKDGNWFDKFIELCEHYYETEPCGGNLHIVLDDGNLEDTHISWCAGNANGLQDHEGNDLANLMLMMTAKQREQVYNSNLY